MANSDMAREKKMHDLVTPYQPSTRGKLHELYTQCLKQAEIGRLYSIKPAGVSSKEWLAVHIFLLNNIIIDTYVNLENACTAEKCPKMTAGQKYEFKWSDGKGKASPQSIPARDYVQHVLSWVGFQLRDQSIFPRRSTVFPPRFLHVAPDIIKRLLRVASHIICHHLVVLKNGNNDIKFVKSLVHVLDVFDNCEILSDEDLKYLVRTSEWLNVLENDRYNTLKS